jgi:hypothetical protein
MASSFRNALQIQILSNKIGTANELSKGLLASPESVADQYPSCALNPSTRQIEVTDEGTDLRVVRNIINNFPYLPPPAVDASDMKFANDEHALRAKLFANYDPDIPPQKKQGDNITLKFEITMLKLVDLVSFQLVHSSVTYVHRLQCGQK